MTLILTLFKEQLKNFGLIFRLAIYDIKGKYQMHYLGVLWQFLSPLLQVVIYWVAFGVGIRHGAPVNGTPYLMWLLCGLIPWFFIAPTVTQGSNSVFTKVTLVSKMKFPVSILPTITIISNGISFIAMFCVLIIMMFLYGVPITLYFLQIPYFFLCLGAILFSLTLLFSTISTMIRDVQVLIQSCMRLLLYISPVLWNISNNPHLAAILKINPFFYVLDGIRNSVLSTGLFYHEIAYSLYFWCLTVLILLIGSVLHFKFRDKFVDYL